MNVAENRMRVAEDVHKRRNAEAACALDFLVFGEEPRQLGGEKVTTTHADRCTCKPRHSRDYDPTPYPATYSLTQGLPSVITARDKALPAGDAMYAGTGIGALYGLGMEAFSSFQSPCCSCECDDGEWCEDADVEVTRSFAGQLAGWNLRKESK